MSGPRLFSIMVDQGGLDRLVGGNKKLPFRWDESCCAGSLVELMTIGLGAFCFLRLGRDRAAVPLPMP